MARQSKRIHPDLFSLRNFRRIFPDQSQLLPSAQDFEDLLSADHQARLLLGHYSMEKISERLEHYGVLAKLKEEGFEKILVRLNMTDPERQQVIIYYDRVSVDNILGEIYLHDGIFRPRALFIDKQLKKRHYMLYIQWLTMQNPTCSFSLSRPALPGQQHPGLKIGHEVMHLLIALAERLKMSGIINIPEFPHAAVLYSRRFRFFNPHAEGQLRALRRDFVSRSLSETSWGIMLNCVREVSSGKPFTWFKEEQVLPLDKEWNEYFKSTKYQTAMRATYQKSRFYFDEQLFCEINPVDETGAPRISL